MKIMRQYCVLFILSCVLMLSSCAESGPIPDIVISKLDDTDIQLDPSGGSKTVRFVSLLAWHIEAEASWLQISPSEGEGGSARVTLKAEANASASARTTELYICSEGLKVPVKVSQDVYVPVFELKKSEYNVSAKGGSLTIDVLSDVEYTCETSASWIRIAESKAAVNNANVFVVDRNTEEKERKAEVRFIYADKVLTAIVSQRPAGTEDDDWKYADFVHRSLAMRFTADWCGYCPYMATAFETARSNMYGSLEIVSVHGDGGLKFSSSGSLLTRFSVQGFPTGVVDNRAQIPNFSDYTATAQAVVGVARDTQTSSPAVTGIAISSSMVTSELTVDISVYAKKKDVYRVTALLLESGIVAYQNGVSNPSEYVHNDVARMALTSISGERVEIGEGGGVWNGTYEVKVPSSYDRDNLHILVYVEKPFGDEEFKDDVPYVTYGDFGGRYVDNCRSVPIKTANEVEFVD